MISRSAVDVIKADHVSLLVVGRRQGDAQFKSADMLYSTALIAVDVCAWRRGHET